MSQNTKEEFNFYKVDKRYVDFLREEERKIRGLSYIPNLIKLNITKPSNEDCTDAEAYWSLVLCRYGIEYVEDSSSHKRIPTVNRAQFTSIFDDDNYKSALQYADSLQRAIYEEEAKAINEIQKGILAISQKEEPFDVFICYKESDNSGGRTRDSVLAQELYSQLTQEGFKVFFSRITLEDKLGSAYEPYIFAALNSAKVMVVIGTKPEFFNSAWVKNEWSRYLTLIKQGQKKILIPAYKDMDPYDLPEEFSHLQAQDMSKLGFMQDLIRGIKKIAQAGETKTTIIKETVVSTGNANTAPLLKRVFMFLEDGDWESADEYCERVLDIAPENAEAYVGKLMAELKIRRREEFGITVTDFDKNANYKKAIRFGGDGLVEEFNKYKEQWHTLVKTRLINVFKNYKEKKEKYWELYIRAGRYKEYIKLFKLREFTIPDGVTSIGGGAFHDCSSLTSITIPDSVTSIGESAFCGCSSLTSITIPDSVTSIGVRAFSSCSKLKEVIWNATNCTEVGLLSSRILSDCENLTNVTIGNNVKHIPSYAFHGCSSLTSVTIGNGVTSIGGSAFNGCSSLKDIYINDIAAWCNISGLDEIMGHCASEKNLYLKGELVTELVIPDSVTSIGNYAFSGCSSLTSITIPDSVTSIGDYAFYGCGGLTSVGIPDSVTSIGERAFYGCGGLTSVSIPDSVTSIGKEAFRDCHTLKITIPDIVTNMGENAFKGCLRANRRGEVEEVFHSTIVKLDKNCVKLSAAPFPVNYKDITHICVTDREFRIYFNTTLSQYPLIFLAIRL